VFELNGMPDRLRILHFYLLSCSANARNLDYILSNVGRVMKIQFEII